MLYAITTKMPANVAMGIKAAHFPTKSIINKSVNAWTMPAIGVRPPVVSISSINATVKSNGVYQLTLDKQQNAVITRQASHFQLSQVGMDSKTGLLLYKYQPAEGYRFRWSFIINFREGSFCFYKRM